MKIQFLGAAGGVTGSSYLLTTDTQSVLVDLGMFQGTDDKDLVNYAELPFDVRNLSAVFLTHAHLDHCGRLPILVKQGFAGKVYATEATTTISQIVLRDSAHIALENNNGRVLYTEREVRLICDAMESTTYGNPLSIKDLTVTFRDAGHILGAASIEIMNQNGEIVVFSGDLGNTPQALIKPTDLIKKADFVVMESTYGDKSHPQEDVEQIFATEINEIEKNNGTLLIPSFSIERAQEVLHIIGHLIRDGKILSNTNVYLDSPMAIEVTGLYEQFPELLSDEFRKEVEDFNFDNFRFTDNGQQSRQIRKDRGAKIIIAGSGMMSGGRIMHHLKNFVSLKSTRILIVGYQAEDTLGREIEEGATEIEIEDEKIPVNAKITKVETLSSHADLPRLLNWLKNIEGVKKVFLTHGEEDSRKALAEKIKTELGIDDVQTPAKDEVVELN
jgi:metallo-beta-lactamase family protein